MDRNKENTPQAALTKAVNDAIANGSPIVTEIPAVPAYQQVFSNFDYDYCALILQLGSDWEDSTWRNDTSPSAYGRGKYLGVRIWFDYFDAALSEHSEFRKDGGMKIFHVTLCDGGDEFVFASDDFSSGLKPFILDGGLDAYIEANPKLIQEARDYSSESPIQGVIKYADGRQSGIQEIVEFVEMDPANAEQAVFVYRDGEDYFWGYEFDGGISAIEGNVETFFRTVEAFKEYAVKTIAESKIPDMAPEAPDVDLITLDDKPFKIPTPEEMKPIIAAACGENDLDAAALKIQDALGVETGDVAGQFFSDLNDGDWEKMIVSERAEKMEEYVRIELLYLTPDDEA